MKQITRQEAEALFLTSKVVSSNVEQDKGEMRILMTLSDDRSFLVRYGLLDRMKRYFLQDARI